jgi:hypothetical protein
VGKPPEPDLIFFALFCYLLHSMELLCVLCFCLVLVHQSAGCITCVRTRVVLTRRILEEVEGVRRKVGGGGDICM